MLAVLIAIILKAIMEVARAIASLRVFPIIADKFEATLMLHKRAILHSQPLLYPCDLAELIPNAFVFQISDAVPTAFRAHLYDDIDGKSVAAYSALNRARVWDALARIDVEAECWDRFRWTLRHGAVEC